LIAKKTAGLLSTGIIPFDEDIFEYRYMAFFRYGEKTERALIKELRSKSLTIGRLLEQLSFKDFDEIFLINFLSYGEKLNRKNH